MAAVHRHHTDASWRALLNPGGAEDYFSHDRPGPIESPLDRFSPVNAWWFSELSRVVYRRNPYERDYSDAGPGRSDFLNGVGLVETAFFDAGGAQAAFVAHPRPDRSAIGILVFRGTRGVWRIWRSNFKAWLTPWSGGGHVHHGFNRMFEALWPAIADTVASWEGPLCYTGHSLGAALATLAAARHRPEVVYTFGSPRVGDRAFAARLAPVSVYRMYNPGDIVVNLPPSGGPWPYCHVGTPVPYRTESSRTPAAPPAGKRGVTQPPQFLVDHAPVNYICR